MWCWESVLERQIHADVVERFGRGDGRFTTVGRGG